MTSRNFFRCGDSIGLLHERFDVAAHGGERSAQLVRHIRDEIAAHAIDAAQIADIVKHEHRAAAARPSRAWPAPGKSVDFPRCRRYRAALQSAAGVRPSARHRAAGRRPAAARLRRSDAPRDCFRDSTCDARPRSRGASVPHRRRPARPRPCPTGWPPCGRDRFPFRSAAATTRSSRRSNVAAFRVRAARRPPIRSRRRPDLPRRRRGDTAAVPPWVTVRSACSRTAARSRVPFRETAASL